MSSRWERFWLRLLPMGTAPRREPDLRLFAPKLLRSPLRWLGSSTVEDVTVELRGQMGWAPNGRDSMAWSVAHTYPTVRLSRALPRLLVSNDFFVAPGQLTAARPAPVTLPVDLDPYDGKTWRVHADSTDFANAVLTPATWQVLEKLGERRAFTVWIDGQYAVAPGTGDKAALVTFATLLERLLAAGALERWPDGPDPATLPDLDLLADSTWPLHPVTGAMRAAVSNLVRDHVVDAQVDGLIGGEAFVALRISGDAGLGAPLYAPSSTGVTPPGLVLLPLPSPAPTQVQFVRKPLVDRSNVHTEWLDFDHTYQVRADDERLGHALTPPLLMQYLYDNQVPRLDVVGPWLVARAARFDAATLAATARMLVGARRLLPRWPDVEGTR